MLPSHRHDDVHRVPQGRGLTQLRVHTVDPCPSGSTALSWAIGSSPARRARTRDRPRRVRGDRQLHLLHRTTIGNRGVSPCHVGHGPRQLHMVPSSSHMSRLSRTLRDRPPPSRARPNQPVQEHRPARRPAALPAPSTAHEDRRRTTVEHHPIVDALRLEELAPALIAHLHPITQRRSDGSSLADPAADSCAPETRAHASSDAGRQRCRASGRCDQQPSAAAVPGSRRRWSAAPANTLTLLERDREDRVDHRLTFGASVAMVG